MKLMRKALILFALAMGAANATGAEQFKTYTTFSEYRHDTINKLRVWSKTPLGSDDAKAMLNAPHEWRPPASKRHPKPEKGILLVHGLGDSPWTFNEIAEQLARDGFLVRTVLLPGHGTHPEQLLDVDLSQWRRVVNEQATILQRDVKEVYLGGFSTGANLVMEYAYENENVAGLLLFSPAFKSSTSLAWITPLIRGIRPWLLPTSDGMPLQNEVRYFTVPTNGFAQFYRSSQAARRALHQKPYSKPVFMVVAQHDSVLDTGYLLKTFATRFTHPASRLIWYGQISSPRDPARILVHTDRIPERRISQFSHMGIMFGPQNRLYGERGSLRICWNGQEDTAREACQSGMPVWYSDWGYREPGKVHARLTYNPYFAWQTSVMISVLADAEGRKSTDRRTSVLLRTALSGTTPSD